MTEQNQQNALLGKIAAYTEIMAKDPKSTIFVSLGEAYRKMGMLDDARQVIESGLENHPDFSPAHIVLARILCQQGEYESSESAFTKALEQDPDSLAALVGFARLEILLGQEEKARDLLLNARQLSPADPVINKLILSLPEPETVVEADTSDGQPEDDISAEEQPSSPPLVSSTVADLYLKQGLKEEALEVFRQLSNDDPDNLLYRRKIRDLEEDLTGSVAVFEQEEEVPDAPEEPVVDLSPSEVVHKEESPTIEQSEGVSAIKDDEKIVATLNKWLDSIQRRRGNV